MGYKNLSYNELLERLGIVVEQSYTIRRGLKDFPGHDEFLKAAIFFKEEADNIMNELTKRR